MILLSPGIAQGCFELLEMAQQFELSMGDIATSFPRFGSIDSKVVLSTSQSLNWIFTGEDGVALITESGFRLLGIGTYPGRLRQSLLDYVEIVCPVWLEQATFGRRRVVNFVPALIQQMFDEADLSDTIDDESIEFWDGLSARARGQRLDRLTQIGRAGERLTMRFEANRTGRQPKWVAIESNEKGYDVLSIVEQGNDSPHSIEVKASTLGVSGNIHVTRNEWNRACEAESHVFHLWDVSASVSQSLAIVSPTEMHPHIPMDSGEGSWESVQIPISVFSGSFRPV